MTTTVFDALGSSCSGSDGDTGRTLTLNRSGANTILVITVNYQSLTALDYSFDFTTNIITFNVAVYDTDPIRIVYTYTDSSISTDATVYATPLQLARYMVIENQIPSIIPTGTDRTSETVGVGDNSTTKFYLDNGYIIEDSYTLRYAASETVTGTELVETTHYSLNLDNGTITLTSAGVTAVGTDNIYANYSYYGLSLTNQTIRDALERATAEIDKDTQTHFTDGTQATPNYIQVTNEKHRGKGTFNRDYFSINYPIPDVSATLTSAVTAEDTTLTVGSTQGFLSAGILGLETDKITYTGKTATTFTGCTGVNSDHDSGDEIKPYIIEISATCSGSEPTWNILNEVSEFDIDLYSGRFHVYRDDFILDVFNSNNPPRIPNRTRLTYIYGTDTIPKDIVRLCLMIASKDLMHTAVRKATVNGKNEFNPTLVDVDDAWITKTINKYKSIKMSNV
jgi:hypothetical protein